MAGSAAAPVIRLPVNPDRYIFNTVKEDYLLFLGRVSPHKGALEAATFAAAAGLPLRIAGPAWEPDYLMRVLDSHPETADYIGEVGGHERLDLIARARAMLVMSQPVVGPFGDLWAEPGATVVSEAAVSGTPVIATPNGCLPEIIPGIGHLLDSCTSDRLTASAADGILAGLPDAHIVRKRAIERWGHVHIAAQYTALYGKAVAGATWA
jgi:glycosyltransferase involved in cell wall biosynthesis